MEDRKKEHLHLAFEATVSRAQADPRFMYEPLLSAHPNGEVKPFSFLGKKMNHPFWISSMTGGTQRAAAINVKLAKATGEFGLGMGLGSCRGLFESDDYWEDFNVRSWIGDDYPFYANLGIAQLEQLLKNKESEKIDYLNKQLKTDGTIIHINPLQEAFQPEGDVLKRPPIECIQELLEQVESPIIVKEVGQGMGLESLRALLNMNIAAIEFGALGGTNFTKLEQMRRLDISSIFESFTTVGHTAEEMTRMVNQIVEEGNTQCKQIIISGGIKSLLDGYYLTKISKLPAVLGMGSAFLNYALKDYQELQTFVKNMINAWQLAEAYLKIK
ncbi:beta/alpha barrel domain-containing protein [Saccharicrinis fermentans]|uniref:Isopentenyl-diphosphate delta-isomerase n=1 Tax=Saccharicrinis fermentans DSM 9555 = JCM 21142 TaxID=869213 RepID=W7XXD0_9BACT|nr:type 2 isopentenyl-diphosphate Delta-isomerase [Saccharicrinis fermentans]GAF03085.1 isopentenyl-diphosphate delta-isomerase [Saccharicrinis fermentans DSM 9555 = JCM 21142]